MAKPNPLPKYNALVLDFDGTLFPRRFIFTATGADPVLVHAVNVLCKEYNFRIVISAGMQEEGLNKCKDILEHAGIDPGYIMPNIWATLTVGFHLGDRYRQVERWYAQYKDTVGTMLAFDDEYCPLQSEIYENWMLCDAEYGLRFSEVTRLYGSYPKLLQHKEIK